MGEEVRQLLLAREEDDCALEPGGGGMDPAMVVPLRGRKPADANDFTRGVIGDGGTGSGPDTSNQTEDDRA